MLNWVGWVGLGPTFQFAMGRNGLGHSVDGLVGLARGNGANARQMILKCSLCLKNSLPFRK